MTMRGIIGLALVVQALSQFGPVPAVAPVETRPQAAHGPQEVEFELIVEKAPQKHGPQPPHPAWFMIFLVPESSPCKAVAEQSHCSGSGHDIAICLARSKLALPPPCKRALFKGGLMHGDVELLHLLSVNSEEHPIQPLRQVEQEVPKAPAPHANHPIVELLRQSCAPEFHSGICSFALADRVCPKKLLHCLVDHRDQLNDPCIEQTRAQIILIAERHAPGGLVNEACALFAWVLVMLAFAMCCMCCIKTIYRCCCAPITVTVEPLIVDESYPSAPLVDSEDAELEMALMISAADAGMPASKVANGIPIVTAHDQL